MLALHNDDQGEEPFKPPSKSKQTVNKSLFSLAVLCHPYTKPAPSTLASIRYFSRVAAKLGLSVHQIGENDLDRLHQYDGLWIRHTTSIINHTFSFACRADKLGIPVIDNKISILACHNKIPMMTMLNEAGIVTPSTVLLTPETYSCGLQAAENSELVIKVPDGSFGRGMYKVSSLAEFGKATADLFRQSSVLMVQPFIRSKFDWRIGVIDGSPLFACQYHFARGHWQIIKHYPDGKHREGSHYTVSLGEVSPEVLQVAVKSTKALGGAGIYGVDIKDTANGPMVIEVNDNPNLDHGIEDQAEGDVIWMRLAQWFLDRKK
jgi:glutathione synthase/RimK-type ligase-like ATP-grasp enzyme